MTPPRTDRKSTRLNSSHVEISYAVFCLKKKTLTENSPSSMVPSAGPGISSNFSVFLLPLTPRPPRSTLFPYTTLFRSAAHGLDLPVVVGHVEIVYEAYIPIAELAFAAVPGGHDTAANRSEEHTSELQSRRDLVCRLLLEKKNSDGKFTVIDGPFGGTRDFLKFQCVSFTADPPTSEIYTLSLHDALPICSAWLGLAGRSRPR